MRRIAVLAVCIVALSVAGILVAQQKYPNLPDLPVVLENDHVVVQMAEHEAGRWSGEHSHAGKQIVVVLDKLTMTYKEDDKETDVTYEAGDVFWIDPVTHDHKPVGKGKAVLINLK